jgi:hypothetical protein
MTAEFATFNFRTSAALDPSTYPGPNELLGSLATTLLTFLPGPWSIVAIVVGLYVIARAGKGFDWAASKLWSIGRGQWRGRRKGRRRNRSRDSDSHPELYWG